MIIPFAIVKRCEIDLLTSPQTPTAVHLRVMTCGHLLLLVCSSVTSTGSPHWVAVISSGSGR